MSSAAAPVLVARDVGLRYPATGSGAGSTAGATVALAGVDLVVGAGERVAVIGPSGAGKSSLLAVLGGAVAPTSGTATAFGVDLTALRGRCARRTRRRIATVAQQFDLVDELRVVHNVNAGRLGHWSFPTALMSLARPREAAAAGEALARLGVADTLHARTSTLSGGQKQRVAVARVLVSGAEVVLADEPIASLDPRRGAQVIDVLDGLDATLVASLHDVDTALGRFARVVALRAGRVVFDRPAHAVSPADVADLYA